MTKHDLPTHDPGFPKRQKVEDAQWILLRSIELAEETEALIMMSKDVIQNSRRIADTLSDCANDHEPKQS